MEHIYKKISLDIHDDIASSLTISVKQGDTARGIQVNLTDHGKVYTIPDGCTATFSAKKDNGKFITDSCTIENNTIIYDLNEDVVSVGARLDCEITVFSAAGVCITSPSFTIFVYKRIQDEYADDIIESDSFKVLDNLISEATTVIAETENATKRLDEAVAEAETAVNNAVSSANEAVESANSAISEANEAIGIAKETSDELMAFLNDLNEEGLNEMLDEVMPLLITFYYNGIACHCEEGMTWEDYAGSAYDTIGVTNSDGFATVGGVTIYDFTNNEYCADTYEICANSNYGHFN